MEADSPGTRLLVDQAKQSPVAEHDDGRVTLEMAFRLACKILRGRRLRGGLGSRLPIAGN
jgi:hypothetical protein